MSDINPFEKFALGAPVSTPSIKNASQPSKLQTNTAKRMRTARVSGSGTHGGQDPPKGLLEKYRSPGEPEWPLRCIVVGHNPSEKAWELGHYYANPSNRMWKLLAAAGIIPPHFSAAQDDQCPIACGVGFTDVGFSIPGTVSSDFKKAELHSWRQSFYDRLAAHARRAAATVAEEHEGTVTKELPGGAPASSAEALRETVAAIAEGCPKVVAFAGKRQWEELFFDASRESKSQTKGGKSGPFQFGLQPVGLRPPGWPLPSQSTEVFVLPSSSGAAAMTNEAREGPYILLGDHLSRFGEWTHGLRPWIFARST